MNDAFTKTYHRVSDLMIHPKFYSLFLKDVWNVIKEMSVDNHVHGVDESVTYYPASCKGESPATEIVILSSDFLSFIQARYSFFNIELDSASLDDVMTTMGFEKKANGFEISTLKNFMEYSHHKTDNSSTSLNMLYDFICHLYSVPIVQVPAAEDAKVVVCKPRKTLSFSKVLNTAPYKAKELEGGSDPIIFNISDMHFFNKIDGRDVMLLNEYNEEIARRRWDMFIASAVNLIKAKRPRYIILAMLGDFYSGRVHNNHDKDYDDSTMTEVVMKGEAMMAEMISTLAEHAFIKTIHVCPGNHPRVNPKDFDATAFLRDNDDYASGCRLKEKFSNLLPYTTFNSPGSLTIADAIEGVGYIFSHGHAIRGGAGQSGLPVASAVTTSARWARNWQDAITKSRTGEIDLSLYNPNLEAAKPFFFKYAMIGHFHSRLRIPGTSITTVGGLSLLGTCKFANNVLGYNSPAGVTYYVVNTNGIVEEGDIIVK